MKMSSIQYFFVSTFVALVIFGVAIAWFFGYEKTIKFSAAFSHPTTLSYSPGPACLSENIKQTSSQEEIFFVNCGGNL